MLRVVDVLVVGGQGLIGSAIVAHAKAAGLSVVFTHRIADSSLRGALYLDLRAVPDRLDFLPDARFVFFCAAVTNLGYCERNPRESAAINVTATLKIAKEFEARGARIIFISSSHVFDGTRAMVRPDAERNPMSEYGRQKATVEQALAAKNANFCVVRLTKVLGAAPSVVANWLECLRRHEHIEPFADMTMAPISVTYAANALMRIAEGRNFGPYQLSASADISYADAASFIAQDIDVDGDLIRPVRGSDKGVPDFMRPPYTSLNTTTVLTEFAIAPPVPAEALQYVIANLPAPEL